MQMALSAYLFPHYDVSKGSIKFMETNPLAFKGLKDKVGHSLVSSNLLINIEGNVLQIIAQTFLDLFQ